MKTIRSFIQKHPVLTYYVLTFAISWGVLLLAIGGPGAVTRVDPQFESTLPLAIIALLTGPSISGILLTGLFSGRGGLREYRSRLFRWRVGVRWYALALLTAPLLFLAILLPLSLNSPNFLPGLFTAENKTSHLIAGLMTGLAAGIIEELGWTGFGIPRLRERYSILTTGLIVGFLWALWHVLPAMWLGYASGAIVGPLSLVSYYLDPFLFLLLFRIFMVWIYDHTGSLFIGMLNHLGLTASSRIFMPLVLPEAGLLIFDLVWAAAMGLIVAIVVRTNGRQLSQQPLGR